MFRAVLLSGAIIASLWVSSQSRAQDLTTLTRDDVNVSYIYAALMGSGTYKIDERRISMLRIPFSLTRRELAEDTAGMKWYAPVVIGYDGVTDNDWLGTILDDDLVTLTVLPGFEYQIPYSPTWAIKPFGHFGAARDFVSEETILMSVLGVRALGTWKHPDGWEFRWGNTLRLAAEYNLHSNHHEKFSLLETGVDYRRDTALMVLERKVNAGVYYRFQYFRPDWDLVEIPFRQSRIEVLHELGISVGLKKPRKFFGITFSRVRVGYKRGDGLRGWTFGTEFPF
jgi:hypothetical protein